MSDGPTSPRSQEAPTTGSVIMLPSRHGVDVRLLLSTATAQHAWAACASWWRPMPPQPQRTRNGRSEAAVRVSSLSTP